MSKLLAVVKQSFDFGLTRSCQTRNALAPSSAISFRNLWASKYAQICTRLPIKSSSSIHTSASDLNRKDGNDDFQHREVDQLPQLMKEPIEVMLPSLTKFFSNFIKTQFIVKPYLDPEFTQTDFMIGARRAAVVVSSLLAEGDFKGLSELFDPEALAEVERNFSQFTLDQRLSLQVDEKDLYLCVPYEVGLIFDDKPEGAQERFVEILMCLRFCKGWRDLPDFVPGPSFEREYRSKVLICNMRFQRNYTKGVTSPWIINFINYFRLPGRL